MPCGKTARRADWARSTLSSQGSWGGAENCTIAVQTTAVPGPAPKRLAVTGGTGTYRNVGGDGTLVEFGNGKGRLTLHLLSLAARGRGA